MAAFPGARGRIPNFVGAGEAARQLMATPEWRRAHTLKCNPDAPQRPVRLAALRAGKVVYVAVPRLREARCFLELDPRRISDLAAASTIGGAARLGRPRHPRELEHVDLLVAGSVAVDRGGARVGKGGGYSDLEYALLREFGAVDDRTVVSTTVHPLQVVDEELPMTAHDFRLDLIVTAAEVLRPRPHGRQPRGILESHLSDDLRASVPALAHRGKPQPL